MVSVKSLKIFPLCCFGQNHGKKCLVTFQIENKNALTAAVCLACMEIRLRNEEAINSARNRIYSLKVFQLLPTSATSSILQDIYVLFVSELIQYVCQRRPKIRVRINTRKFKGLDSTEITSLPEIKKVIYMVHHFNHRRK